MHSEDDGRDKTSIAAVRAIVEKMDSTPSTAAKAVSISVPQAVCGAAASLAVAAVSDGVWFDQVAARSRAKADERRQALARATKERKRKGKLKSPIDVELAQDVLLNERRQRLDAQANSDGRLVSVGVSSRGRTRLIVVSGTSRT